MSDRTKDFRGAKLMLFAGAHLIVLRRDHTPGICWPGRLDFPGGGREGAETPEACVLRETEEEIGLRLDAEALELVHVRNNAGRINWFFAAHLPKARLADIKFGGEGAGWLIMPPGDFVTSEEAIPHFREILKTYLNGRADAG